LKKTKEEQERLKRTYDDKVKKQESEWIVEKECIEREHKEKIEALT